MNQSDPARNAYLLKGALGKRGYMRWWHSFTGTNSKTGEVRTFFVEYFIINPALGKNIPILGQHPRNKKQGAKPSYVMIKAGVFQKDGMPGRQINCFYPISSLKIAKAPLFIQVEDCTYSENHISGYVELSEEEASHRYFMSDAGFMEWDLDVCKSIACHTGPIAGPIFSALNALDSFWHGEGIRTAYSGTVNLDGDIYEVTPQTGNGYADKHWGKNYNRPWLQLAGCKILSKRTGKPLKYSALAIDGCCPRFLWFPLRPKLLMQLTYTGEDFCFSFARPGSFSRIRYTKKETNKRLIWHIKAQNKKAVVKLSMNCLKQDMIPLHYETPLGIKRRAPLLGSAAAKGTLELYRITPQGPEWLDTLTIENALCEYQEG